MFARNAGQIMLKFFTEAREGGFKKMTKNKKNEVAKVNEVETANFIQQAIQSNLPVETMEKLFALHEKFKANQAKEAYISAISKFQQACPVIKKTKPVLNKDGRTVRYRYAPIDSIIEQIKNPLADNGLSYRLEVENKEGAIKVKAIATHILGHSESSSFEVPITNQQTKDGYSFMTAPQTYASALTFAKRYALCNVLGISTGDEDTDANDVGKEPEPKSVKSRIIFMLRDLGHEPTKWSDKEWADEVKKLTSLTLTNKNLDEIANRLSVIVSQKNEDVQKDENN